MEKAPKVAVIGTNIGSLLHVLALRRAGFEVTTMVGQDPDRTAERAKHFGIPLASTSIEAVLDSDIDVVVVATPPAAHHPITMAAIAAGKHVLCEKPLALSSGLAREMRDAADAAGVVALVEYQFRWRPPTSALREVVRDGRLGELIQGSFEFDHPLTARPGPLDTPSWWRAPETGGGWLRNWNAHGIDLVRFIIGDFAAVSAQLHPDPARGMTADDAYAFAFVLKNGMQGVMTGSCRAWAYQERTKLIGSDASAVIDSAGALSNGLVVFDRDGPHPTEPSAELLAEISLGIPRDEAPTDGLPPPDEGAYAAAHRGSRFYIEQSALCTAFLRRIRDRSYSHPALAGFSDGLAAVEVIEAVERSNRERRWIELS